MCVLRCNTPFTIMHTYLLGVLVLSMKRTIQKMCLLNDFVFLIFFLSCRGYNARIHRHSALGNGFSEWGILQMPAIRRIEISAACTRSALVFWLLGPQRSTRRDTQPLRTRTWFRLLSGVAVNSVRLCFFIIDFQMLSIWSLTHRLLG